MTKMGKGMTKKMGNSGIVRVLEKEIFMPSILCWDSRDIFQEWWER